MDRPRRGHVLEPMAPPRASDVDETDATVMMSGLDGLLGEEDDTPLIEGRRRRSPDAVTSEPALPGRMLSTDEQSALRRAIRNATPETPRYAPPLSMDAAVQGEPLDPSIPARRLWPVAMAALLTVAAGATFAVWALL